MGMIKWLWTRLTSRQAADPPEDEESSRRRQELSDFLISLSRNLNLDANARVYFTRYIVEAQSQIRAGESVLFGPEATLHELAAEGAYQGLLDPLAQGTAKGAVLRDDLMMRVLVHYATKGNRRSMNGVLSFAAGTFRKRSEVRGAEEALRIAKQFVESPQSAPH